jgi:hypothetical protein
MTRALARFPMASVSGRVINDDLGPTLRPLLATAGGPYSPLAWSGSGSRRAWSPSTSYAVPRLSIASYYTYMYWSLPDRRGPRPGRRRPIRAGMPSWPGSTIIVRPPDERLGDGSPTETSGQLVVLRPAHLRMTSCPASQG